MIPGDCVSTKSLSRRPGGCGALIWCSHVQRWMASILVKEPTAAHIGLRTIVQP